MKCVNCGAELRLGSVYCSVCGQEAQIVSEFGLLEEELLQDLLHEGNPAAKKKKKSKRKKFFLAFSISFCVLMAMGISFYMWIGYKNHNSYSYQIQRAEFYRAEGNMIQAVDYYKRALELDEKSTESLVRLAEYYLAQKDYETAKSYLDVLLQLEEQNTEAFQMLLTIYEEQENYELVLDLRERAETAETKALFWAYEAETPEFSLKSGTYAYEITVALTAAEGETILYTTDGSDPKEYGVIYWTPFEVKEQGILFIRAVSRNQYGVYSEIAEGEYEIVFQKPSVPVAIPERGKFSTPTSIKLVGTEGSQMYYTWDGSTPTTSSKIYTEPIIIPEGNHILSVLLVDKYGMHSDILKCNYEYIPSTKTVLPRMHFLDYVSGE